MKLAFVLLFALLLAACDHPVAVERPPAQQQPPAQKPPAQPPVQAAPAVDGPKLPFIDEAPRDAALAGYRDRLLVAVRARDANAVASMVDPNIRTSFGGGGGRADFEKLLPDVWDDLVQILTLGGTFSGEGEQSFWAPYVYSTFPDRHDAFTTLAVIADDVPLREAPNAQSRAIATLSRDIVERISEDGPWIQVKTADGRTGYVEARFVRSPVGYRAGFNKGPDGWRMTALVAGD
jgi:hypothetical protein